jgi:hypothetical protein
MAGKEVIRIKIFRKMHRQVELKIKHAMATGKLHHVERSLTTGDTSRQGIEKSDGTDSSSAK